MKMPVGFVNICTLERLEQVHLYPGMPVQVMVVTGERTLLEYLVQPLHDSLTRAFREE